MYVLVYPSVMGRAARVCAGVSVDDRPASIALMILGKRSGIATGHDL
jgi:hypothetical protein